MYFLFVRSGNLASKSVDDHLVLQRALGCKVVGPPDLYDGKIAIAVGGAHLLAMKVAHA